MLQVLVATLASVPVLARLERQLVRLPTPLAGHVLVAHLESLDDAVAAALHGLPVVRPLEAEDGDDATRDLEALARAWTILLEGAPFADAPAYPTVVARIVGTDDLAAVRARLEKAGLTVGEASTLPRPAPETEAEAIARARAPFGEHFPDLAPAVEAYLRGQGLAPIEALRAAPTDYYTHPADVLSDAITGAAERWHAPVVDKLFALFAQTYDPRRWSDLALGLTEEDLPPELGLDRASLFYEKATAHGIAPVHAAAMTHRITGRSSWFFAPAWLATPEAFDDAAKVDLAAARAVAAHAVPKMWLDQSPTARRALAAFFARGSAAIGAEAAQEALSVVPEAVGERHVPADDDVPRTAALAAALEARIPGVLARTTARWANAASPLDFVVQAANLLERDPGHVDADVVWDRALACIEASPQEPFPGDSFSGSTVLEKNKRPSAAHKARIERILAEHGPRLPLYYRKRFEKLSGKKPAPSPYDAKDLEGLDDATKKALETARTKSHAAGLRLPPGLPEAAIAKLEKSLGSTLPAELRAFYARHDGAGDDECFGGQQLFGLARAVETRRTLLEGKGRPFDPALLPLTSDGAGNHACIALSGKDAGQIVDFDHETGRGRRLAKGFAAFLKSARWGE